MLTTQSPVQSQQYNNRKFLAHYDGQHCPKLNRGPHWMITGPELRIPRILCVDDDVDVQTALKIKLRKFQVDVELGFFGMQGISEAIKSRPDLILTDLAMPNGNGQFLIECVKQNPQTASIPIIVLTGMSDPSLKNQTLNAGADAFLRKPVLFDELVHQLSRFIDLRECKEGAQ